MLRALRLNLFGCEIGAGNRERNRELIDIVSQLILSAEDVLLTFLGGDSLLTFSGDNSLPTFAGDDSLLTFARDDSLMTFLGGLFVLMGRLECVVAETSERMGGTDERGEGLCSSRGDRGPFLRRQ
jgi:hypothetical protein